METSKYDNERPSRRTRSRKPSTLSARLNPDFDIKDLVKNDNNGRMTSSNDELDPKTMNFDELVSLLHPSFISDYLQKIMHFLKSDKLELRFPNIAPYKEAFLVKIVDRNDHLACVKFNEISRVVARQILDVVDGNRDVYKWGYSYENGMISKNVLIYRKIYINRSQNSQPFNNFKVPCTPSTPTSTSLATSMEDLNLYRTSRVALHKMPKSSSIDDITKSSRMKSNVLNTSNISTDSSESSRNTTKIEREVKQKRKIVQSVNEPYRRRVLQDFSDFVCDSKRASFDFTNVGTKEYRFLECITCMSRRQEYYQLFSEECVALMKSIARAYQRDAWKLQMDAGKLDKWSKLRTITFFKVPNEKGLGGNSGLSDRMDNKASDLRNTSLGSVDSAAPRHRAMSKDRGGLGRPGNSKKESESRRRSISRDRRGSDRDYGRRDRRRSGSRDRRNQPISGITFQSAGAQAIDPMQVDGPSPSKPPDPGVARSIHPCARKNKLLVGLSTPLESDRAERMMRLMGWEGGALGARGEGITEPIMPALHLAPGAGLGHVKVVKPKAEDFREHFLRSILIFLQSDLKETSIVYQTVLTKRQARFMKPAITAFNERKNIGLGREQEMNLVHKIKEEIEQHHALILECRLSDDKKEVHLLKTSGIISQKAVRKRRKKSRLQELDLTSTNHLSNDLSDSNSRSGGLDQSSGMNLAESSSSRLPFPLSSKAAMSLVYRMIFMENIKDFVQNEDAAKEYRVDCIMSAKQKEYILDVITNINRRMVRSKFGSNEENEMYREIRKMAGDCYMSVVFRDDSRFTLFKKYYQKRFTNSSLDLPPPRSKDPKNTVTYKNGVAIYNGENENHDDKHNGGTHNGDITIIDDQDEEDDDSVIYVSNNMVTVEVSESEHCSSRVSRRNKMHIDLTKSTDSLTKYSDVVEVTVDNEPKTPDYEPKSPEYEPKTPDLPKSTTDNDEYDLDCDGATSKDISMDLSNESLMLDLLETDNAIANDTKAETVSIESDFDKDIKELEKAILHSDLDANSNGVDAKPEVNQCEVSVKVENSINESSLRKELEINNNLVNNRNNSNGIVNEENSGEMSGGNIENSVIDKIIKVEVNKDLSPSSSKRSRSDSENSEKISRKFMKVDNVHNVCISLKNSDEKIDSDTVQTIQNLISEEIDCSTFLPLLECQGIKNGGLIYSCHNEKSFTWLNNVISVASDFVKITEAEKCNVKNHKLKFKMNCAENVDKVLYRLEMYNAGLQTVFWEVIDVQIDADSIIITVMVDEESYKYICRENFSLFAGVDKAQFSVVWD